MRVVRLRRITLRCGDGREVDVLGSEVDGVWVVGDVAYLDADAGDVAEVECRPPN